jgi:hypothetical protein
MGVFWGGYGKKRHNGLVLPANRFIKRGLMMDKLAQKETSVIKRKRKLRLYTKVAVAVAVSPFVLFLMAFIIPDKWMLRALFLPWETLIYSSVEP